jgi:putative membrane protein
MKTVKKIFFDDVISLIKNFFALTIVVGICFLPALYAWFNIYSNWDPYANTGALKIAAVSLDEGFTDDEGEYHNQGDTIIENLHENTAVDWQFVETSDEAINGVYSGKYYAAVVIDKQFTYNMYNVLTEEVNRPTLLFYENQKKNPVATKISDTVVQSLQNNINVAFTEVVVSRVFSSASDVSADLEEKGGLDETIEKLESLSNDLNGYQNTITEIIDNDAQLQAALQQAKTDANNIQQQAQSAANAVASSASVSQNANVTLSSYADDINSAINLINTKASEINQYLDIAAASNDAKVIADNIKMALQKMAEIELITANLPNNLGDIVFEQAKSDILSKLNNAQSALTIAAGPLQTLSDNLESISATLEALGITGLTQEEIQFLYSVGIIDEATYQKIVQLSDVEAQKAEIQNIIGKINALNSEINNLIELTNSVNYEDIDTSKIQEKLDKINSIDTEKLALLGEQKLKEIVSNIKTNSDGLENLIKTQLRDKVSEGLTSLTGTLNNTNALLNSVGETFGNLVVVFSAIDNTIDCANTSLDKTREAIVYVNGRLIDVIDQVKNAASNEKISVLVNALSGDPEVYGKFFSTPVEVVTEAVYPVENYGSAVAPFYSTLAFWVGALILTAIIKIKPDKDKYPDASARQLYFGRYVLYWLLGQIQAVIIVLGDLFLLHVQCIHPGLFMLAASVIATTFTILIYSIVVTWGDAGKALAVVIVVIQIAGSSGTYPIELLPDFFKKVYIFFPFPYAINAIRECLCGMYELDYLKYLGCLGIFIAVSLVIGLLIRVPFESLNHYMEERMEDTEMM